MREESRVFQVLGGAICKKSTATALTTRYHMNIQTQVWLLVRRRQIYKANLLAEMRGQGALGGFRRWDLVFIAESWGVDE